MKNGTPKRGTKGEENYVRAMKGESAFDSLDRGRARILSSSEYPPPLKRFRERERKMVHVTLSVAAKRKLEAQSRRTGKPVEELARRWIEQGLRRNVG